MPSREEAVIILTRQKKNICLMFLKGGAGNTTSGKDLCVPASCLEPVLFPAARLGSWVFPWGSGGCRPPSWGCAASLPLLGGVFGAGGEKKLWWG